MIFRHAPGTSNKDLARFVANHSGDALYTYKIAAGIPLSLSMYYPAGYDPAQKYPVFLFVHGGSWESRKIFADQAQWNGDYLGFLARYYADKGYISVSMDYRMLRANGQLEGFTLTDLYEDCADAVRYLQKNANQYGLDFENTVLLGESAGGYLTAALATFSNGEHSAFQKLILVNAITDLFDPEWKAYVPANSRHPLLAGKRPAEITRFLSPAYRITKDCPKTLLIHGVCDTVVSTAHSYKFYDQLCRYRADTQLHLLENTNHVFLLTEYQHELGGSSAAACCALDIIDGWLAQPKATGNGNP